MSKNIDSFNRVVGYVLGEAYGVFPCLCSIEPKKLDSLIDYGCNGYGNTKDDKIDFATSTIHWLAEEANMLHVSEGFGGKIDVRLTIKGLQHLKKVPKSIQQNIGDIFLDSAKKTLAKGIDRVIDDAFAFGVDSLLEGLL